MGHKRKRLLKYSLQKITLIWMNKYLSEITVFIFSVCFLYITTRMTCSVKWMKNLKSFLWVSRYNNYVASWDFITVCCSTHRDRMGFMIISRDKTNLPLQKTQASVTELKRESVIYGNIRADILCDSVTRMRYEHAYLSISIWHFVEGSCMHTH